MTGILEDAVQLRAALATLVAEALVLDGEEPESVPPARAFVNEAETWIRERFVERKANQCGLDSLTQALIATAHMNQGAQGVPGAIEHAATRRALDMLDALEVAGWRLTPVEEA